MERIDWLETGREYWEGNQDHLLDVIKRMTWNECPCSMGFSQDYAIKGIIEKYNISEISFVAFSPEIEPDGLLGVRAHLDNADVDLFFVDDSDMTITPICAHLTEKPV